MKLLCVGKQLQFAWTYNAKFNVIIVKDEHVPKNGDGKASIWRWVVSSEKNNKTFINGCSITTNIFILSIISTLILYCIINLYCIYILLIASLPLTTNTPQPLETTPFITTPDVGVSPPQYAVIRPPQASVPPGSAVQLECNAIGMLVHISPFCFWGLSDHVYIKGVGYHHVAWLYVSCFNQLSSSSSVQVSCQLEFWPNNAFVGHASMS